MRRALALILGLLASGACGQQPSEAEYARYVAADVKKDCVKGLESAPSQAHRAHLQALCDCSEKKIASTAMGRGDNDKTVGTKVQNALKACLAEVGDTPSK